MKRLALLPEAQPWFGPHPSGGRLLREDEWLSAARAHPLSAVRRGEVRISGTQNGAAGVRPHREFTRLIRERFSLQWNAPGGGSDRGEGVVSATESEVTRWLH